ARRPPVWPLFPYTPPFGSRARVRAQGRRDAPRNPARPGRARTAAGCERLFFVTNAGCSAPEDDRALWRDPRARPEESGARRTAAPLAPRDAARAARRLRPVHGLSELSAPLRDEAAIDGAPLEADGLADHEAGPVLHDFVDLPEVGADDPEEDEQHAEHERHHRHQ